MFGKYRIVSKLGHGSTSQVFLAEHMKLRDWRAIKCISKSGIDHPQFLLEADILKNLKHPGIPTIYDIEEDEMSYYLIEEYIQGKSLEAFMLHQECISIEAVVKITTQLCQVMQYLHQQRPNPIIYQDLKPEHIIVCEERIVLVDFGIASYFTSHGNAFHNFGTIGFAPPEKYQGISCDTRSDIYGIGKILEFMAKKLSKEEFQILKPIIQKSIAADKEFRFPSAEAFQEALDETVGSGSQNIQETQTGHLFNKEIAVVGTQARVGATHFAISMTCYFNKQKKPCIYQENYESECMRRLSRETGSLIMDNGIITREKFYGVPCYGNGVEKQAKKCIYVNDYGVFVQNKKEIYETKAVIITGGRPWEHPFTREVLDGICPNDKYILVCNYNNRTYAKELAKRYHQKVYCFPLDADPFSVTREKRRFFEKLLSQEGW